MNRKMRRLIAVVAACFLCALAWFPQLASALDTPNALMGIDGMVLQAGGIFRDPGSFNAANGNDGFNTFQFGAYAVNAPITTGMGKYDAFRFRKTDIGDCCISHNARFNSNTPEHMIDSTTTPQTVSYITNNLTQDLFPIIDRAAFGQLFDPDQYQIEVKFKPLLQKTTADSLGTNPFPSNPTYPNITAALENTAPFFQVSLDQHGGYVWDAEAGSYKHAAEQVMYNIGSDATPLNNWYAAAPKDAQGYATYTVPITSPSSIGRSPYFNYGDSDFRTNYVVTNGGRTFNETTQAWEDVTVGYGANFQQFGGGPSDPSNPGSKLNTPNGVALMYLGSPSAQLGLSLEIKSIGLTKINPTNLVARLDANSGISFRFGSGLTYGETQPGITVPGLPIAVTPAATDQISRFDANGMTNLKINMRSPNDPSEVHRFLVRGAAVPSTFDATDAVVNVRAKLLAPLTDPGIAQNLTLVAKDRKGNDDAANMGADEWNYSLDLSQFNTSTMTTVSIPMSAFTRNMNSSTLGAAPLGFANSGDGSLTNFGLYEFGGLVPAGGLLKLELEFMEIRLPELGLAGDFNGDHTVNAADYTVWRNNKGAAEGNLLAGNGNGGVVDESDYELWKLHFGESNSGSGGLAAASAVPEPGSCASAALALAGLGFRCRRQMKNEK